MKTILKLTLITAIMVTSNFSFGQSYSVRLNNHQDSSITYIYNITINSNNTANITRTSVPALPTDQLGMQVIGTGYSYDPISKMLILPSSSNGQWWGIDNNYNGSVGIINGGTVEAKCPCSKGKKECDVSLAPGGCLTCVGGDCKCAGVVTTNVPNPSGNNFMYSIIINVTSVTFTIIQ